MSARKAKLTISGLISQSMLRHFPLPPYILTGLGYFLCAEIGNALARFDNGVAFLWPATALLTAILAVRRPAQWAPRLIVCGIASIVASGLWGHGWVSGIPLAVANLAEAALAATLMRRFLSDEAQIGSLRWLLSLLFGVLWRARPSRFPALRCLMRPSTISSGARGI